MQYLSEKYRHTKRILTALISIWTARVCCLRDRRAVLARRDALERCADDFAADAVAVRALTVARDVFPIAEHLTVSLAGGLGLHSGRWNKQSSI